MGVRQSLKFNRNFISFIIYSQNIVEVIVEVKVEVKVEAKVEARVVARAVIEITVLREISGKLNEIEDKKRETREKLREISELKRETKRPRKTKRKRKNRLYNMSMFYYIKTTKTDLICSSLIFYIHFFV